MKNEHDRRAPYRTRLLFSFCVAGIVFYLYWFFLKVDIDRTGEYSRFSWYVVPVFIMDLAIPALVTLAATPVLAWFNRGTGPFGLCLQALGGALAAVGVLAFLQLFW